MFSPEHQPTSFREFIEKISTIRALTVLRYYIEEHRVLFDEVPEHKELLDLLWTHNNDLDHIQMYCAIYLEDFVRAAELAEWIRTRDERLKPPSIDEL